MFFKMLWAKKKTLVTNIFFNSKHWNWVLHWQQSGWISTSLFGRVSSPNISQVNRNSEDLPITNHTYRQEGHDGPGLLTWVIFPTNKFYIFVPLVPTCDHQGGASFDPKGHHVNKIDKGLQGDATYWKSKLYLFQFQRRRILKLDFFVPMFQLVTQGVGSVLTPKESYK